MKHRPSVVAFDVVETLFSLEALGGGSMALKAAMETGYLAEDDKAALHHRINRLKGHADAVSRMIDSGKCVDVILTQVAALKGAASQLAIELARGHLANCAAT